jgi:predicted RND superfamily exporter protein
MLLSAISGLSNPEELTKSLDKSMESWDTVFNQALEADPKGKEQFEQAMEDVSFANTSANMRDNSFFSLIANLLTLIGAVLMLRLKKNGFRLYVLGCIIGVVAPVIVFGSGNFLGLSYAMLSGFSSVLFILLYAFKLKYMD